MNATKFFVSSAVAASVVAVIGLAYAQTPPSPTSPVTSPGMQETNPPLPNSVPNSTLRNNRGTTGNMNAPTTGGTGMSADGSAMTTEPAARDDRN